MRVITFKKGSFEATIDLEALPQHPVPLTRKLLKNLFADAHGNRDAISDTSIWILANIIKVKSDYARAYIDRNAGYHEVKKGARSDEAAAQRTENDRLEQTLKNARSRIVSAERLKVIFNEFMN
jgi:hypothetical protein